MPPAVLGKSHMSYKPTARGLYFEEFAPGRKIISGGRTITEADLVGFAAYAEHVIMLIYRLL